MQEFTFKPISSGRTGRVILLSLMLLMIILFITCRKDEVTTKEYPRLNSLEVTGINESGATFNAEIISGNTEDIIEYGFVWDTENDPAYRAADRYTRQGPPSQNQFSADIHSSLKKSVTYYVRAYLKTAKYLVYGKIVSFMSLGSEAPITTVFFPKSDSLGETIKIIGKNFSSKNEGVIIKMSELNVSVVSISDSTAKIVIPDKINSEFVTLK